MRGVAIFLVVALGLVTACNGSDGGEQSTRGAALERSELRVGVGNPIDTAPLRMAVADGSFARDGLHVDLVEDADPRAGLNGLSTGKLDVAFATDVALFTAAAHGTALQLQGEAYTSAPYTMALVTLPGSTYTDLVGRKAPKIAVNQENDLGTLAARSMFATAGGDPTKIRFVTRSYDQMPAALRDGSADAALMTEPFITKAQQNLGARVLADSSRGATMDFPVSAYAATGLFAQANVHTLAAFREVLADAQQRAADQSVVRQALPRIAGVDETTAALVALGQYPTSLNGVRLQRVADLMHNTGMLADRLDVPSLLPKSDT
ncbi:ABC transporter substrate-binding protein [Amycolatopsis acidiphila]|uniref:ABC transporter substrate-binding protein n=1 Tax=Amycolatopsis acidiphila TaxID=715473 RepID=A0A558AJL4_9PSEU|nr:ABC transporter substrate-binding protein [Amycolatopsis acidiphila]TVT24455.1 ABC transporter substrate-binding protein [Amycolatopsis acidiphila]UIJ59336.1 ABC transporter substrate-binding protein [Amycolatopsis acidiphila]GHG79766.1 sulfonate ABC transporter substrate-binding protein [Amycolatopsis acidiphila]